MTDRWHRLWAPGPLDGGPTVTMAAARIGAPGYPAVICLRLLLAPPTRPVRRLGAGMATGVVRVGVGVALVRRKASAGHMCTACWASFSSQLGTGMLRMTG